MKHPSTQTILAVALAALLTACSGLQTRADTAALDRLLADRGRPGATWSHDPVAAPADAAVHRLLARPLTRESALQIAMLRSPRIAAEYARLGLARADVIDALAIANPGLGLARRNPSSGAGSERSVEISLPLLDALLLPVRMHWARQKEVQHLHEVAQALIDLAADVESGWYHAVAAAQVAAMRAAIAEGTAARAELAQRFHDAGNIADIALAREQAAAAQARIDAARARSDAVAARLTLASLLGLGPGENGWTIADRLPLPVPTEDDVDALVAIAERSKLALLAARVDAEQRAAELETTRTTRWFGGVTAGAERERETDGMRSTGPSLHLELPLFHQGQGRLARADALLAAARARVHEAELSVSNDVLAAVEAVTAQRAIVAAYRDELVPQRDRIVARSQQAHDYMLLGVFELVQARLDAYAAYQGYIEAVRDYWLARVALTKAVGQRLPSDAAPAAPGPAADDVLNPGAEAPQPHDHGNHRGHDHGGAHGDGQHSGADRAEPSGAHAQHGGPAPVPAPGATGEQQHPPHRPPAAPDDHAQPPHNDHDGPGAQP